MARRSDPFLVAAVQARCVLVVKHEHRETHFYDCRAFLLLGVVYART
jgi:hypothetical protein